MMLEFVFGNVRHLLEKVELDIESHPREELGLVTICN